MAVCFLLVLHVHAGQGRVFKGVCQCLLARARQTDTIHTNTLRGLKIYLLFNRLVRRYVMSVNVNVNVRVGK